MDALFHDIRYAFRHLRRSAGFAAAAILTLAVGVGAQTAAFSMLNALMLKRLPIEEPDGLIGITPKNSRGLGRSTPIDAVTVLSEGPLEHLCGYLGGTVLPAKANGVPVQTLTTFVTGQCFGALRVRPGLGRAIDDTDAPIQSAGARVAVISHRLWTSTFNSAADVLGKTMLVNNVEVEIVGVLPPGFVGLEVDSGVDIFTTFDSVVPATRARRQLAAVLLGRLRPGLTLEQAEAQVRTRWPAMLDAVVPLTLPPTERANLRDSIPYLQRMGTGLSTNRQRYGQALRLILLLTSLLLLLACINLGGLLLLRWNARNSEVTVRLALGGTRWRLARQLVIESLLLSLTGVALAIPIAQAVVIVLASMMPPASVPYTMSFAPDATVLAAATGVGILVGVLMSAVPLALASWQAAPLHLHSERTIAGSSNAWSRGMLVAQVALSIVMLICASLLTRSLYMLQNADLGVRAEGILDVKLYTLPDVPYARGQRDAYYPPLLDQVAALPSVRAAALAEVFPRGRSTAGTAIAFAGPDESDVTATTDRISPGFFETMGIPLRAGRTLQWSDTLNTRQVAVVSESLARALSPDGDVLDRHVKFGSLPVDQDIVIVGVAADATQGDPRNAKPRVLYRPILQAPVINASNPNLLVATSDAAGVVAAVRGLLAQAGQHYVQEVIGVDDVLARAPSSERMSALLAGAVGGLAVLIAIVGIYGTFAYSVSRRKREIGVRVAIGAAPRTVARSVLRDAVLVALGGVVIALPLAYIAARALKTLMFGVTESDPITFLGSSLLFVALAMAAAIVPARRAASVDPAQVLRGD